VALEFFDPTGGQPAVEQLKPAARITDFTGLTCSILDNGKQNSDLLLSMVGEKFARQFGVTVAQKVRKKVGSAPAKTAELDEAVTGVDFVLVGTGD